MEPNGSRSDLGSRGISLRQATSADLQVMSSIHSLAFPGFLLTRLGPRFLNEYYRIALGARRSICLVLADPDVCGFVVGYAEPSSFYSQLSTRRYTLARLALGHVILRPGTWAAVLRGVMAMNRRSSDVSAQGAAELASLAVLPDRAKRGAGGALVGGFVDRAREEGCIVIELLTDADENEGVNRFYRSLGFSVESVVVSGPRRLNRLAMTLPEVADA